MMINDTKKTTRLGTDVDNAFYIRFKQIAVIKYGFHGATKKSVTEAFNIWVSLQKYQEDLNIIADIEYNHIENPQEQLLELINDAVNEFISNHKNKIHHEGLTIDEKEYLGIID